MAYTITVTQCKTAVIELPNILAEHEGQKDPLSVDLYQWGMRVVGMARESQFKEPGAIARIAQREINTLVDIIFTDPLNGTPLEASPDHPFASKMLEWAQGLIPTSTRRSIDTLMRRQVSMNAAHIERQQQFCREIELGAAREELMMAKMQEMSRSALAYAAQLAAEHQRQIEQKIVAVNETHRCTINALKHQLAWEGEKREEIELAFAEEINSMKQANEHVVGMLSSQVKQLDETHKKTTVAYGQRIESLATAHQQETTRLTSRIDSDNRSHATAIRVVATQVSQLKGEVQTTASALHQTQVQLHHAEAANQRNEAEANRQREEAERLQTEVERLQQEIDDIDDPVCVIS